MCVRQQPYNLIKNYARHAPYNQPKEDNEHRTCQELQCRKRKKNISLLIGTEEPLRVT